MTAYIEKGDAELLRLSLDKPVGGSGVASVDVILVELTTTDGMLGRGLSYVLGSSGILPLAVARNMISSFVNNKPIQHPENLSRNILKTFNRTGLGPNMIGLAAIDTAMWDLYATLLDCPVGIAMGGDFREVKVYGSGGFNTDQSPDEVAIQARKYIDSGVSAVKVRVSGQRSDELVLEAVSDAIGDRADLMLDANEKCDLASATRLVELSKNFGVLFLEEPLPAGDIFGYRSLASNNNGIISLGEHLQGLSEAKIFMADHLCSVMQPDLAMMGGLTESLKVARFAETTGVSVSPHFLPNIFVHLAAASPSITWLEDFPLLEVLFRDQTTYDKNGNLSLPKEPGLGIKWNEEAIIQYKVDL
ncbi:MAG: mandelate racemase/muconate lactonizing enzyme family protein [Pseudomonadota bacterium]|nr:mandelate racemase/muconate lactonizing enzyme family protein [Pseudomonadota bacterium]